MFENMAGPVGFAMHEDRLAQVAKNMQRAEAEQGRRLASSGGYREALVRMLVGLAARIAPSVTLPGGYTPATGR